MKTVKIKIGDREYNVKLAESDEDKAKGLQNKYTLAEDEGMLFVIDEEDKDEDGEIWF